MEEENQGEPPVANPIPPMISPFAQVLQWIGYDATQAHTLEEELGDLATVGSARRTEIADVLKTYSQRTKTAGQIISGLSKTTKMQALAHWVRDFRRLGAEITIEGHDQASFLKALIVAEERADARATDKESADARAKEASPGKLTTEKDWDKWETRLINQLSILQGVLEVPLVYVIREENVEDEIHAKYATYTEECIAKCPLEGPYFEADARTVHQLIESYTTGENSEVWIKRIRRAYNGRKDMEALRAHYRGEGNQTRRISDAESMRDTLHYRGEGAMPFATFLAKVQRMFNLFDQIGEPYTESAKLRFLLDKVQNQDLKHALEAVRIQTNMNPEAFTFTSAANHLSSLVKPRAKRELAAVNFQHVDSSSSETTGTSIYKNGKIHTGYYPNWRQLSKKDRDAVLAERDRLGKVPSAQGVKSGKQPNLKRRIKTLKKKIAALKRKAPDSIDESDDDGDDAPTTNDAGNSFGGRAEKASKKKRNN